MKIKNPYGWRKIQRYINLLQDINNISLISIIGQCQKKFPKEIRYVHGDVFLNNKYICYVNNLYVIYASLSPPINFSKIIASLQNKYKDYSITEFLEKEIFKHI